MDNILDILQMRGLVEQLTHENEIRELLGSEKVAFYIGFDPTADSLHVGHFTAVLAMMRMQQAGHIPIVLIGGGTAMVGDPTGKVDMRRIMTKDEINFNASCFKKQLSKFIDFNDDKAFMVNNADWLLNLNYVDFLRDIGVHFSVNRMLTAEAFKSRMEKGLSFLEFNYMLMQSYDFLELNNRYNCKLQLGGNDQWSNIISGVELIRKVKSTPAFGMTFSLLTTSTGIKMGKTESGAVWLDADKTSPYDFYQYWRNVDDRDVRRCFCLLTFYSLEEIDVICDTTDINKAKEMLAYAITALVHGEQEAANAQTAARALFAGGADGGSIPTADINLADGDIDIISLLINVDLVPSRSEARRLVSQGGIKIDGEKANGFDYLISVNDIKSFLIQKGKKVFLRVNIK